jgi:hypothetical protein
VLDGGVGFEGFDELLKALAALLLGEVGEHIVAHLVEGAGDGGLVLNGLDDVEAE